MVEQIISQLKRQLQKEHPKAKIRLETKIREPLRKGRFDKLNLMQAKVGLQAKAPVAETRKVHIATIETKLKAKDGTVLPSYEVRTYDESGKQLRRLLSK